MPLPKGFGTIWTTVAIDLVGFGIVLPILPQYAKQFGASATTTGLLVASFSLAQLICAPLWGKLSDRIGRKPVLVISLFGTAAGSLLTGLAGAIPLLFLGRIVDGASGASVSVAQASVADLAPARDRARLMGLLGAAFGVGFVAGPAIGAVGALWGPHVPFYIAAAISGVNALLAIKRLPETARGGMPVDAEALGTTEPTVGGQQAEVGMDGGAGAVPDARWADRRADAAAASGLEAQAGLERSGTLDGPQPGTPWEAESVGAPEDADVGSARAQAETGAGVGSTNRAAIMRLISVSFVGMVAFSGFEATFSLLAGDRLHLHLSGTGAVFTVIGLALVLVQVGLIGRVNDALGESGTLRAGLGANVAGLALLSVDGGWFTLVPSLILLVLGQGLITPTLSSAVAGRAGRQRGEWLGWQQSAGGLARVLGPIAAGALYQHVRPGAPYVVGAVLAAIALALVPRAESAGQKIPVGQPT